MRLSWGCDNGSRAANSNREGDYPHDRFGKVRAGIEGQAGWNFRREFVRRSVDFCDPEEIAALAQLAEFAEALQRSNQEACDALDRALASIEATRKQLDKGQAA